MVNFIKPKPFTAKDGDGQEKNFIISKFDCVFGREVAYNCVVTALPKVGDYMANEDLMMRALAYAAVVNEEGTEIPLKSKALVLNHCTDWVMLKAVHDQLLEYNDSFLLVGTVSTFFETVAQMCLAKVSEILTPSSDSSLTAEKQPSTN